ncbi:uncharacterized protein B0T15DRAFT_488675 [Chaetomium strumarium]|uniref:Uncharacterized protein n=1 Tax=Chaetomium strumarium TaxID=1170767 RepID=A0AAJ0M5T5_9PEZI|nr:hypothetical protein B0T15DRAFT_488675 [Chaetomium strumarium]
MALGQVEFTVLLTVVSGFLIFTPERLVLLRSLCLWAVSVLAAWHGYAFWKASPWAHRVTSAFTTGRGLEDIADLAWNEAVGTFVDQAKQNLPLIPRKCVEFVFAAFGWTNVARPRVSEARLRARHPVPPARIPPRYLAILVTTPPIHTYGPVSEKLYTTADEPKPIPWTSTDAETVPSMMTSLAFRRHFALCLVDEKVWRSRKTTVAEKLSGQLFWDYCGDSETNLGAGPSSWPPSRIAQINALQVLGVVPGKGDATSTCTSLYNRLRDLWGEYLNIWWNDADFALVLAYLLVDYAAAPLCCAIMRRMQDLRDTEVTKARGEAWRRNATAGAGMFVGSWVLTVATGGLALPLTGPAMAGSFLSAVGSAVTEDALKSAELTRGNQRREACERLQKHFPRLQELLACRREPPSKEAFL